MRAFRNQRDLDRSRGDRYRTGNSKENSVRKITGLNKASDVTLKRGVIGSLTLYPGSTTSAMAIKPPCALVIQLQSEDHSEVVQTWKLIRARIVKYSCGPFNARSSDIAIEEMVLGYERLELE